MITTSVFITEPERNQLGQPQQVCNSFARTIPPSSSNLFFKKNLPVIAGVIAGLSVVVGLYFLVPLIFPIVAAALLPGIVPALTALGASFSLSFALGMGLVAAVLSVVGMGVTMGMAALLSSLTKQVMLTIFEPSSVSRNSKQTLIQACDSTQAMLEGKLNLVGSSKDVTALKLSTDAEGPSAISSEAHRVAEDVVGIDEGEQHQSPQLDSLSC